MINGRFFRFVLTHPWMIVILSILFIAAIGSGARYLHFKNDYRMFFSEDNPQLQAFEAMQNTYTKVDNVLFVISPKDGNVFTRETLATVEWLTKEAWQIPYSIRVDRRVALHEPLLVGRLISPDGAHTGINVTIQLPGKKLDEVPTVAEFAERLAKEAMQRNPNVEVRLTGMVIMNATFPKLSQRDMKTLYPVMILIILVAMSFMLRSIAGVVASMGVLLVLSVIATMGFTGWLGIYLSPPTVTTPVVVMTLAVADCIHIIVLFLQGLRRGETREEAMMESLRLNLGPVFLTSITTAIGFLDPAGEAGSGTYPGAGHHGAPGGLGHSSSQGAAVGHGRVHPVAGGPGTAQPAQ